MSKTASFIFSTFVNAAFVIPLTIVSADWTPVWVALFLRFASLSFLDENKEKVQYNNETLEKEFTIEPAQVKPDGTVLAPLPNTSITINLTADEYTNYISKTKKLAFTYSMKGNDGKNVQIKASDWLELKASFYVSAKTKVTPE